MLDIYDIQLAEFGHNVIMRLNYIDKLNFYGEDIHKDISSGKEIINLNT